MAVRRFAGFIGAVVVVVGGVAGCGSSSTTSNSRPTTTQSPSSTTSAVLTYRAGYAHFSADFPSKPRTRSIPASFAGENLLIQVAAASGADGPVEVAEEDISPALPSDQVAPALGSALKAVTSTSNLTVTSPPATTSYRSYTADAVTYSDGSRTLEGISFVTDGDGRLFLLLAPSSLFSALESSFQTVG